MNSEAIPGLLAGQDALPGFTVNADADAGASLSRVAIEKRLKQVRAGDVIIAHMNKPASDSAEGLSLDLIELLKDGFTFARLDQVDLVEVPAKPSAAKGAAR